MLCLKDKLIYDDTTGLTLTKLEVGDKLWIAKDPYDKSKCLELEQYLNKNGFKTRVGRNIETKEWSVAIIE